MAPRWDCRVPWRVMRVLPTGTLSLLFSDMEGSTRLLARLGSSYAEVLGAQRAALRTAWASYDGIEMGTEGDSFFVVFDSAVHAVQAAVEGQRNLMRLVSSGGPLRVRMGIHTGSPQVYDNGYVGMDVHRAARISAAAHGGQVIVSAATASLLNPRELAVSLKDLGFHRLKDLPQSEHLYQVLAPGLLDELAPVRSLGATTGLPAEVTHLVGRVSELDDLLTLLSAPDVRLVTLTGPGGSGKTRLANQLARLAAHQYPDGVFFVPLATALSGADTWELIGQVLGLAAESRTPARLLEEIRTRHALLVLDNLEQVTGVGAVVTELLTNGPFLTVVATSRRSLHARGEHQRPVGGLGLPVGSEPGSVSASDAGQLFVQHARMVRPEFRLDEANAAAVAEICTRLDGLPLAIELVAARVKVLSPGALLPRLTHALDMGGQDADRPDRQRTIRAAISWSHRLLSQEQRELFDQLGVFVGGADLPAVMEVIPAELLGGGDHLDLISDLADASLLVLDDGPDGDPRITMLETIRTYARDQLQTSGRWEAAAERHLRYFHRAVGIAAPDQSSSGRVDCAWMDANAPNLLQALKGVTGDSGPGAGSPPQERLSLGLQLADKLYIGLWQFGRYEEGHEWLGRVVQWAAGSQPTIDLAAVLVRWQFTLTVRGDLAAATAVAARLMEIADESMDPEVRALAYRTFSFNELALGRSNVPAMTRALQAARLAAQPVFTSLCLQDLAMHSLAEEDTESGLEWFRKAVEQAVGFGNLDLIALARHGAASTLRLLGRHEEALLEFREVLPQYLATRREEGMINLAEDVACLFADLGDWRTAARLIGAADTARADLHHKRPDYQEGEIRPSLERGKQALGHDWELHYREGAAEHALEDELRLVLGSSDPQPAG